MKKIMIALLAIAVLFGFAACDNSSSTPDDDTTTSDVSYETYKAMASDLATDLGTALSTGFVKDASIVADGKAKTDYTFKGTSFTYTKTTPGATDRENETYSLTLNGVLIEDTVAKTVSIQLTDYVYTFSKPFSTASGALDFTRTTGTASGYLDGTLEVTLNDDKSLKTVDVPNTDNAIKMFLPEAESKVSLFYGESEVIEKEDVISIMNFDIKGTANPASYTDWRTTEIGEYETEIKGLVKTLLTDADANVFSTAVTDTAKATKKDYVKASYTQGTDGGSITITYSLPEDAASEVVIAGNEGTSTDKATVIKLGKGDSFTIVLSSKAGDATNSFPVDSYTITEGTFKVYKYSSTDTALVAYDTIEEFTVEGLTGAVSGLTAEKLDTDNNANANVTGTAASQTATAGDASAMIAVGPARDAEGAIVPENVPVEITSLS